MKWVYARVMCASVMFMCNAQPPGHDIVIANADSKMPLVARNQLCEARHQFGADVRDHTIDVVIAGFYLLGSGFSGLPKEVQWGSNAVASTLWIVDSVVRMVAARRTWLAVKNRMSDLRGIVVDQ